MKNMDFNNLGLVNPPPINDEAETFAHNAMDILQAAQKFSSLKDALSSMNYVAGTSRRRGRKRGAFIPVEDGTQRLFEIAQTNRVAVLFGREDRGLYNEEVDECGFLMTIPVSKKQPSLNLAQAVMIISYELSKAGINNTKGETHSDAESLLCANAPNFATQEALSHLYERMEEAFQLIEYIPSNNNHLHKKIMQNLKHCLGRSGLSEWELNMFHAICGSIERKIGEK
jgi:TrmH family RNA methyltransferase